jgi:hypothetical protein
VDVLNPGGTTASSIVSTGGIMAPISGGPGGGGGPGAPQPFSGNFFVPQQPPGTCTCSYLHLCVVKA